MKLTGTSSGEWAIEKDDETGGKTMLAVQPTYLLLG